MARRTGDRYNFDPCGGTDPGVQCCRLVGSSTRTPPSTEASCRTGPSFQWSKNLTGKGLPLVQDFSDSEEDLDFNNNNKEVRWGFYPTPPSPNSGGPEFVPLLEGGEWDDLDLDQVD